MDTVCPPLARDNLLEFACDTGDLTWAKKHWVMGEEKPARGLLPTAVVATSGTKIIVSKSVVMQ